jgi:hypothetical protein
MDENLPLRYVLYVFGRIVLLVFAVVGPLFLLSQRL